MNKAPIGLVVGDWLSPSETFIYDQVVHQQQTYSYVCARQEFKGAQLRFPYRDVTTLSPLERKRYKWLRHAPAFEHRLREVGARLIHAHFGTNGAHALNLVEALKVPMAVTFHGHDVAGLEHQNRFKRRYFYYQLVRKRLFSLADLLICSSSDLAERLIVQHGAPESKVIVHSLGVALESFRPVERTSGSINILMVGRLVEKKGMAYGIRAFSQVIRRYPDARLTIIGDGPLRHDLEALAQQLDVSKAVKFRGAQSQSDVLAEMQRAHLLLAPSIVAKDGDRESGMLVIKEAAATGIPTIGSHHGGIPEIIDDEKTGYLVPERDVNALGERLLHLVSNSSLREALGRAALEKARIHYDTKIQNYRLESRLMDLL